MKQLNVPDRFSSRDVRSGTLAGCLTVALTVFDSGQIYGTLLTCLSWVSYNRATESLRLTSTQAGFFGRSAINLLPSTIEAGIGGHWKCEIDEGVLVKMSAGDQCLERDGGREGGKEGQGGKVRGKVLGLGGDR